MTAKSCADPFGLFTDCVVECVTRDFKCCDWQRTFHCEHCTVCSRVGQLRQRPLLDGVLYTADVDKDCNRWGL